MNLDATVSLMGALADATRVRLLALLANEELSVAELTRITGLPQSRISTHLGRLRDCGLLRDRRAKTSSFYALTSRLPTHVQKLLACVEASLNDTVLEADRQRLAALLEARQTERPWLESVAGEMERHYSPGRTWETTTHGLLGFVRLGDVLDLGSGDGVIAELIAPRAHSLTCVDSSQNMVRAAQRRLTGFEHVKTRHADMHELPFPDQSFDQVICFNSLTYSQRPGAALGEMARVLRPGGSLSLTCLHAHSQREVTAQYGHSVPGFRVAELTELLTDAGLQVARCQICSRERDKPYFEVVSAVARARETEDPSA